MKDVYKQLDEKLNQVNCSDLPKMFRALAMDKLSSCSPTGLSCMKDIDKMMRGVDEDLTEAFLLDSIVLCATEEGTDMPLITPTARSLAKGLFGGRVVSSISLDSQRENVYSQLGISGYNNGYVNENDIDSHIEEYYEDDYEDDYEDEDDFYEDEEEDPGELEDYSDEEDDKRENQEEENRGEEQEKKVSEVSESDQAILRYYSPFCTGTISELIKRYTGLFSSGYEVNKPDGMLCRDGIVRLSGSKRVVYQDSIATHNMYEIIKGYMRFTEMETRSIVGIANKMYSGYIGGRETLYFPNKLIEIAYGLKAVTGDNQDSLNTYEKHASSANWSAYVKDVLEKSVRDLVKKSALFYVKSEMKSQSIEDFRDNRIASGLQDYLLYILKSLSTCVLMVDYKARETESGENLVSNFKIRICDPDEGIQGDITPEILEKAFMGGIGDVPFSYDVREEPEICLKEFAHEFNHDMSQALPLFAYKALMALQEQGVQLSWENLILGMAEDGSILRNGTHGIDIRSRLTHNICAGSRAGKGVMTLAILACAIASGKFVHYIDRKPDMASVMKYLSPEMFVINGGGYQTQYDTKYKQFTNLDELLGSIGNVPKCALDAFQTTLSWDELGDIVYMRALKLVLGTIVARGEGRYEDENLGGTNGILLVVDEFKNFQDSFSNLLNRVASIVPPTTIDKDTEALNKGSISQSTYNKSYNDAAFYALSFMNSLADDMKFLSEKTDAGFNQQEVSLSDIFVIGQNLTRGMCDRGEFEDAIRNSPGSGRYRSAGSFGLKGFHLGNQSIPYTLVNFKTADAFFGRNMDDGRSKYLAQTDPRSKALGRLDDKASNFAYMETFTEEKRQKIDGGNLQANIEYANSCTYFKPFLILNTGDPEDDCVKGVFSRCKKNAGITPEELIADNPDPSGVGMNRAIGFEKYLELAGVTNIGAVLGKSSNVMNYVVQNFLHYPGNWFQFLVDLRPEWMFTIKDISIGAKGEMPPVCSPTTNPVLEEFVNFNPAYFQLDEREYEESSENVMGDMFSTDEDYTDFEKQMENQAERMSEAFGYDTVVEEDDEIDLYDSVFNNDNVQETGTANLNYDLGISQDKELMELAALLDQLKAHGISITKGEDGGWSISEDRDFGKTQETEFADDVSRIDYSKDVNSLADLIRVVTNDVITKFGGLDRFTSFKVIGGSLVVNRYYYRCKIKESSARNIPYDIRRQINSGNISSLFDYSAVSAMKNIRDLEFDSISFVYDYVSTALGIGRNISVDRFFDALPSLQVLTIGKRKFTRNNYMQEIQGDDLFYVPRKSSQIADYTEKAMHSASSKSWDFAKSTARNRNYNLAIRILGGAAGGIVAGGAKGIEVGSKIGRQAVKGIGSFARGMKDLFNN